MDTTNNINNPEISLKELIVKLGEWKKYLLRKWKIILLAGILGALLGGAYSFMKKNRYEAELTFVLEEGKSNSMGAYAGIASQFGIDLGSASGGSGVFSVDNIISFLTSRLMVEKTLLLPINYKGADVSLADMYADFSGLKEKWSKKIPAGSIKFPPEINRKYSVLQDSLLGIIYGNIIKKDLIVTKADKKSGFILVKCVTGNELFSKIFTEQLVNEAAAFYIITKTKRSKFNVDLLQKKADSLEKLLNQKTYSAALSQDLNMNPAKRVSTVSTELVTRDKVVLQTMYGEVIKNLELSRMSMAQETPVIAVIDSPILPLKKEKLGMVKGTVIGAFLVGFVLLIILVLKRLYTQIMAGK